LAILSDSARVQLDQRTVGAEQLLQPCMLGRIAIVSPTSGCRVNQIERVDADAELEGVVALDCGRDFVAQEIGDPP